MEVVLHSQGKKEKMTINGEEIFFKPGIPTPVPDEIGESLLEKSNYLTPKEYETWKAQKDKKRAAAEKPKTESKKKKEAKK